MSQLAERIAQFRKMAQDDPENDLAHFRLGQLLLEDGQTEEAARTFQRALVVSPDFSKVYQLLAQCQGKLGRREEAVETLTRGYGVADRRGDRVPRDEMGKMLTELGAPVPAPQAARPAPTGSFQCSRPGCIAGGYGQQLPGPPVPDAIGERIYKSVCAECWNDWLKNYSIKVINELRLDLSTEQGQHDYDTHMRGFFGFED